MSHFGDHALPDTAQAARVQRGRDDRDSRRDSRLLGQIVPLSPPIQTMGGVPGPIYSSMPTSVFVCRSTPAQLSTVPVNVPGFVANPRTPENPIVYPTTPHPWSAHPPYNTQPIPAPFLQAATGSVPAAGPSNIGQAAGSTDSLHLSGSVSTHESGPPPTRAGTPPAHPGGDPGDDDDNGSDSGHGGGHHPGPPGPPGPGGIPLVARPPTPDNDRLIINTISKFGDALNIFMTRSTAAPRSTKLNLRNPDTFDGSDPSKLQFFLTPGAKTEASETLVCLTHVVRTPV